MASIPAVIPIWRRVIMEGNFITVLRVEIDRRANRQFEPNVKHGINPLATLVVID